MDCIRPDVLLPQGLNILTTTRQGGCSPAPWDSLNLGSNTGDSAENVYKNRQALTGLTQSKPICWLKQIHGKRCVLNPEPDQVYEADAAITDQSTKVLAVLTADCLPIVVWSQDGSFVSVIHAGWRGLHVGVIEAALSYFPVPASNLSAWLGPGISANAYEVGEAVRQAFCSKHVGLADAFYPNDRGRYQADLFAIARQILNAQGVANISGGQFCTYQDSVQFYSYRRASETGRQATLAWID